MGNGCAEAKATDAAKGIAAANEPIDIYYPRHIQNREIIPDQTRAVLLCKAGRPE